MMVMKKRKVEEEYVAQVLCNKCGKEIQDNYGINVNYSSGYYSDAIHAGIEDGCEFEFDLCEVCLGALMRSFKIEPKCWSCFDGTWAKWRGKSLALMRKLYKPRLGRKG